MPKKRGEPSKAIYKKETTTTISVTINTLDRLRALKKWNEDWDAFINRMIKF